jgi:hypothetical protein
MITSNNYHLLFGGINIKPMKKKPIFLLLAFCLLAIKFYGQSTNSVTVSYEKNSTNDTVWLTINTLPDTKPGTLMLIASSGLAFKPDTAFYPVIDSSSIITLAVSPEYKSAPLQLKAFFYPEIFEVSGQVLSKTKNRTVSALLITSSKRIYNKPLKLTSDNRFTLPGFVFEKQASLMFKYGASDKNHPDVTIQQTPSVADFTDSVFSANIVLAPPAAVINPSDNKKAPPVNRSISTDSLDKKYKGLSTVTVTGKRKTDAQKFNETYSTPLFQDINEKVIDCLSNQNVLSYPDCLSYIRSQVPGIIPSIDKFGESTLMWRGHSVSTFFIDEIPVTIDELLTVNASDIAIIKAYPPPFNGYENSGGGAIALYTRRGEFRRVNTTTDDDKWLYSLKGYTSPMHTLFSNK